MTNTTAIKTPTGAANMTELAAVRPEAGHHRFFLNHLGTVKVAAGDSPTGLGVVEFCAPRGFGTPVHVHDDQDEVMYLIEGEIRLGTGPDAVVATQGSVVSLPSGTPHVFQVLSEQARFLSITAGRSNRPTFDDFVVALSDPADPNQLPEPQAVDPGEVAMVGAAHGIQVLGPPPAELE